MAEKKNGFQEFSEHAQEVKVDPAHAAAKPAARAAAAAKDATQKSADSAKDATQKGADALKDATERNADTVKEATARGTEAARNIADQGAETARRGTVALGDTARSAAAAGQEAVRVGADTARRGAEAANDATQQLQRAGTETARRGLEAVGDAAQAAAETSWVAAQGVGKQAAQAGRSALDAASMLTGAAQDTTADIQALAKLPSLALGGAQEMRHAWSEWMTRSVENAARASQEILRSTSLQQVAEVQSSFMKDQVSALLERNAEMLRIAARLSQAALRPIEERQQSR
jgi:hypothetical protein